MRRELLRDRTNSGKGRLPDIDRELRGVEAERERHEEEGIELGFPSGARARGLGRGRSGGPCTHSEDIGLEKIGLRPGLRFSSELEMFNPSQPPRELPGKVGRSEQTWRGQGRGRRRASREGPRAEGAGDAS